MHACVLWACGLLRARLGEKEGQCSLAPVGDAGSRCLLRLDINLGNSGCARVELVVGSLGLALADATGNECECCRRCGWNERSDWLTRAAGIGWDVPAMGEGGRLSTRRF